MPTVEAVTFRLARADDVAGIVAIEDESFAHPWPRAAFEQELQNEWSTIELAELPVDGAPDAEPATVGFMVYWIVEDELHLLDIAVSRSVRRQGLGRHMMERLERLCAERGLVYLTLEVRVSNHHAISLYEALGYETIHRRKRYYVDNREDALVFAKVVGPST